MLRLNTTIFIHISCHSRCRRRRMCQIDPLDDARGLQSNGGWRGRTPSRRRRVEVDDGETVHQWMCVCCMLTRSSSLQDDKGWPAKEKPDHSVQLALYPEWGSSQKPIASSSIISSVTVISYMPPSKTIYHKKLFYTLMNSVTPQTPVPKSLAQTSYLTY